MGVRSREIHAAQMHGKKFGDAVRTDRYRYVEWRDQGQVTGRMLYDHEADPGEDVNIAERPEHAGLVKELSERLAAGVSTRP